MPYYDRERQRQAEARWLAKPANRARRNARRREIRAQRKLGVLPPPPAETRMAPVKIRWRGVDL